MRTIIVFIITTVCLGLSTQAQEKEQLIQLSGILVSMDNLGQVSYALVANKTTESTALTDYYGYFSIVTRPGDTLLFKSASFQPSSYIVPDTLTANNYSIIHVMEPDTVNLPKVNVYPWPSKEAFAQAFVEMDPYDDAIRRIQRNLSGGSLTAIAMNLPTNSSLSYDWEANQQQTQLYTKGSVPVNNLLNPFSWAQFINAWKNGDLKRTSEKHSRAYRY